MPQNPTSTLPRSAIVNRPPTTSACWGAASASDIDLLGNLDRVIDLKSQVADGAFHLGVTERLGFIPRISFLIESQRRAARRSVLAAAERSRTRRCDQARSRSAPNAISCPRSCSPSCGVLCATSAEMSCSILCTVSSAAFQRHSIEVALGDKLLQPGVLRFKLPQPLDVVGLERAELLAPCVNRWRCLAMMLK